MKRSPTMEELKADIERLQSEIDAANMEQGYCKIPFPPVSDVWAEQAYKRNLADMKQVLADYVDLLLTAEDILPLGESENVCEWINVLEVAREANDTGLGSTCTLIVALLRIVMSGNSKMHFANLADIIADTIDEAPYSVYGEDAYKGDYDGNYEQYYADKREELLKWREN